MTKIFRFKAEVWVWPGVGGLHFVNLPKDLAVKVKKFGRPYGRGLIKIRATVGKTSWVTALFPNKQSESYMLSIKQDIRKKENVWDGDTVNISFVFEK